MSSASDANVLSKERLDEVVDAIKKALSDEEMRALSQRAVQGKVWHLQPALASYLSDLRKGEDAVRGEIMELVSSLVYRFHEHAVHTTLARAGILPDDRVHAGSSLDKTHEAFDLFCLDAKERLYLILKQFGWLQEFFRRCPIHFYENSFTFVDRIPKKKLKVKVKIVGLGVGGSMAVSGLAKAGIESVVGYEKRDETGARRVGSRYQNASWRAYDIAEKLLDEPAYNHLITYRQRLNVNYDDGTSEIVTSDRVQIILGSAIEAALGSAKRYGAKLVFSCNEDEFFKEGGVEEDCDIVALFTGAHTSELFPGLREEMGIHAWPDVSSDCKMWLRIQESERDQDFCTRGGEIGAEKWHYTIESSRRTMEDVVRIKDNLASQYKNSMKRIAEGKSDVSEEELTAKYEKQQAQCDKVIKAMQETKDGRVPRFDYIFTNAPDNDHNKKKREAVGADGTVVLDGGYRVDVKIASKSAIYGPNVSPTGEKLLRDFSTDLLLTGGDACVPPNPLAAYGATLACEAADMIVQLAVGHGHLNSILSEMEDFSNAGFVDEAWIEDVKALKNLLSSYYDARGRAENYFQWVQTLICNLYSLPPMAS